MDDYVCEASCSSAKHVVVYKKTSSMSSSIWRSSIERTTLTLDSLPEDVLLELFSYLNSSELYNLCVYSARLNQICWDHRLWRKINDCCNGFSPSHGPLESLFNDLTTRIKISSSRRITNSHRRIKARSSCLGPFFFKKLQNSPNLKTFIVEYHSFEIPMFKLAFLPQSLTELRLTGSHIFRRKLKWNTVFKNIHNILPNLEILDLSYCQWMKSPALMWICKCAKLKTLILLGCHRIYIWDEFHTACVFRLPMISSLETLDVRKTDVGAGRFIFWPFPFEKLKHFLQDPYKHHERSNDYWLNPMTGYEENELIRCLSEVETLVIRNNGSKVTDSLLKKLRDGCGSLKYLDITNSNCTAEEVAIFQHRRPDVELVHESISTD